MAALARGVTRFWLSTRVPSTSARRIEIFFDAINRASLSFGDFSRSQETGVLSQNSEFRIQESGVRSQKPGVRSDPRAGRVKILEAIGARPRLAGAPQKEERA